LQCTVGLAVHNADRVGFWVAEADRTRACHLRIVRGTARSRKNRACLRGLPSRCAAGKLAAWIMSHPSKRLLPGRWPGVPCLFGVGC
jgi:hypothetical protein